MTKNPHCPSRSELSALVLGKLAPESMERVAKHVDTCVDCRSALDTVGADDPLVVQIKRPPPVDEFIREPEFRRGVEQLRAMKLAKPMPAELTTTVARHLADSAIDELRTETGKRPGSNLETHLLGALPEQFGRYRILRSLGKGGMGAVYLAHDSQLDRQVAVKVPQFAADAGADLLERFYQEARAAATLNHPNICPVHDVAEIDGVHYLVMAYIDGSPLSKYVKPDKAIPPQQVAVIIRKLALALQDAHDRGIVHRDLKPANIMVNKRRELIIMDFGLARIVKKSNDEDLRLTRPGEVMGTPAYMSPEQVLGETEAIGPATDIYALGVIMYELLSGRLPFRGGMGSLLAQIVANEPPPPSSIRPSINPQIEAICLKAMAKSAQNRYASMTDFAAALADYLHSSPPVLTTGNHPPQAEPPVNEAFAELAANATPPLDAAQQPRLATARRFASSWTWITVGILVLGLSAWLLQGVIFKVMTTDGTIVIEIDQPDAQVLVDGEVITITRPNDHEPVTVRRELGKHELRVTKAGFETFTKKFTLDAGKPEQVKVTLQPIREAAENVATSPSSGADREAAESSSGSGEVAGAAGSASATRLTGKLPVPDAARLNELQRVAREAIKTELVAARPADLTRLAQSFIARADKLDIPEEKFALLDIARDLAAQAGDLQVALDICERLDREYLIDAVAVKLRTLQLLARADSTPNSARLQVLTAGFEALAADNYPLTRDAVRILADLRAARPERLPASLLSEAKNPFRFEVPFLEKELDRTEAAYNRLPTAAKMADRPTKDPEVNTARGLFVGLVKNDWLTATEFLRAAGEPWRAIAEREEARPNSAADREAIGDLWWKAADGLVPADAMAAHRRARYWYLGALAQLKPSERAVAATRLQPRIDQVQRSPIRLRVRMTDLSGYHWLRISSDGVRTTNRGHRKITGDIFVNHLRWTDHVAGHRNSGAGRLLPDGVDFTTTHVSAMSNSRWGAVHVATTPEAIDLTFWHAPSNEKSNFDLFLSVESAGYDLPSRFTEQWEVAYYNLINKTIPVNDSDWAKLIAGPPADRLKMNTINFVSDASPTDEWRPGAPPSKNVGPEHFAIVANTTWQLPAGKYQVRTYSDDGIRVFIDGKLTHDNWRPNGNWHAASKEFELPAGNHQIRLEYYQVTDTAILQFNLVRLDN